MSWQIEVSAPMPGYVLLPDKLKWAQSIVTYSIALQNYGNEYHYTIPMPFSQFWPMVRVPMARAIYARAFKAWSEDAGLAFEEVPDGPDVNIRIGFADISGYGAWCTYRPIPGTTNFAQCLIQHSLSWMSYFDEPWFMVDLTKQTVHEIGHALGFDHSTGTPSVMGFAASGLAIGSVDIEGMQFLYGPARPQEITTTEAVAVATGCQNDQLNLLANANVIVQAGAGADQVATGSGDDVVMLGEGSDYATTGAGADTVEGSGGFDQINLGAGDDSALGGTESDQIAGNEGDDIIDPGPSADWVAGGTGINTFILRKGELHGDVIADFVTGRDKIKLIGFGDTPLVIMGNGTYWLGGEMFICGPIDPATDIFRE